MRTFIVVIIGLFWTFFGSSLFAQSEWETLPVFHGGRVMPLHTFARQTVQEICGTTRPYVIRDDATIAEFNQIIEALRRQNDAELEETSSKYPFLIRNGNLLDGGFNRTYSIFEATKEKQHVATTLPIQGLDRIRVERIANRIRQLIPSEGRYFTADEILLAWICEPEVWSYIPIFLVPETDYLDEMFDLSFKGDVRTSQYRISLYQLEKSQRYKQRCIDIQRRHKLGQITQNPVRFDEITERLARQSQLFRELTFNPQRQRPDRMLSLLYQAAGLANEQSSYSSAFDAWGYLLALGEVPGRQTTERASGTDEQPMFLHPTTQRWHDIADKLRLLIRIYEQTDSIGTPILPNASAVEQQYEFLIDLLDTTLAESAVLMESVYPGLSYRLERNNQMITAERLLPRLWSLDNQEQNQTAIRRTVICYYYSVKKLRSEIEAAYLALYDNGHSLRLLPIRSALVLAMGSSQNNSGIQPWASAQMIFDSGEAFVKRFFEPQIDTQTIQTVPVTRERNKTIDITGETDDSGPEKAENFPETPTNEKNKEVAVTEETQMNVQFSLSVPLETDMNLLFLPFETEDKVLQMRGQGSVIGLIRHNLRMMQISLAALGGKYGNADFNFRALEFQRTIRQAAIRIETYRKSLVDDKYPQMVEHFEKTAFPDNPSKLLMEYRYDCFNPFFWMCFFALFAVLLNGTAHIAAATRHQSVVARTMSVHSVIKEGEGTETELPDYTNSIEEWLFISSVVMLTLSMLIAFIGGVMRAKITGWAPVTNMYETVVMMAFATAVFGVWYALYPLLNPALQQAWIYSKFLSISTLLEWLAAMKAQKSTSVPHETQGEAAMREAAAEFGVPGGLTFGSHSVPIPQQTPKEFEAQRRIKTVRRKMRGQCLLVLPRLILTIVVFYLIVQLANGVYVTEHGFLAATANMFATDDVIDLLAVAACILLVVWIVPHILLTVLVMPVLLARPRWIAAELGIRSFKMKIAVEIAVPQMTTRPHSEMSRIFSGETKHTFDRTRDNSGTAWLKQARNAVLDRKLFIAVTAGIVFIVGLITSWNRAEFNPDIRPIAAVLRCNFWLSVHVIAIVVSYAAAFAAWGMAVVALGYVVFGRYQRIEAEFEGEKTQIWLPEPCQLFSSVIERLIKIALLLLVAGTVLGARWADYSWGRFWGWDPKEVWALITILFYVIVLHGKIARYYGAIGIMVGALFASIAVIITWYGINFVFKSSVHAYGGGVTSNAMLFLGAFIAVNILWGTLALLRYGAEMYGNEEGLP